MLIYIPQNLDPFNTHLKNLVDAYKLKDVKIKTGYASFISGDIRPDIIHFHQYEGILWHINFDEKLFFEKLDFFKKMGVIFLYTAHNLQPHRWAGKSGYEALLYKFFDYIDLFIHHGEASVKIFQNKYSFLKNKHHIVCHHGDYLNDMRLFHDSTESAREILKFKKEDKLILIFGQLQFKNTSFAWKVFNNVRQIYPEAKLVMAGIKPVFRINRFNKLYYFFNNKLINKFRKNAIIIHKRFTQNDAYLLFMASDVIFLPHKEGLTTGIIPLAATLGRPFVYPDIGVFREQAEYCFAEKYQCANVDEAVLAISKILDSVIKTYDNSLWLENNNWKRHVENILSNLPISVHN